MNLQRVGVMVLRYIFIYRRSPVRLVEVIFWPTMSLLVWGFVTTFIQRAGEGDLTRVITFLIGAMICWDILFRAQQGVALSFLEDVWARNLLNIFCAPVRLREYVFATFLFGLMRVFVTLMFLSFLAWLFYHFNFFALGFALIPFIANLLVLGLTIGIIAIAIILRYGHGAEPFAWALASSAVASAVAPTVAEMAETASAPLSRPRREKRWPINSPMVGLAEWFRGGASSCSSMLAPKVDSYWISSVMAGPSCHRS